LTWSSNSLLLLNCWAYQIPSAARVGAFLQELAPGSTITFEGKRPDGTTYQIPLKHTFNNNQIAWFKAGSALNAMKASS
jgi:aconitase A